MFGWSRKLWIFSYLMNWVMNLSFIILALSISFKPTIRPVLIYCARYTLPNLPSPNIFIILKLFFDKTPGLFTWGAIYFLWTFLIKEGTEISVLNLDGFSVLVVEYVSFKLFFVPSEFLAWKFEYVFVLLDLLLKISLLFTLFNFFSCSFSSSSFWPATWLPR